MHIPLVEAQVSVYTPWQIVPVDIPTPPVAGRHTMAVSTSACAVFTDRLVWFGPYSLHSFVPSRASDRNPVFCFCGGREATHDAPLSRHRILIRGRQRAKCYVQ